MPSFETMRRNMVKGQLLPGGIRTPELLKAFKTVPREKFVPYQLSRIAYMDAHFPLFKERFLMRPATLARLLEASPPQPYQKFLYIGCATGYGPSLLSHIGLSGVALDCEEIFTQEAEQLLQELGFISIEVRRGNLEDGCPEEGPYDLIIVEGTVDFLPQTLVSQLTEGGKILFFTYVANKVCKAVKYTKSAKTLAETHLFETTVPSLTPLRNKKLFVFSRKKNQFVYGKS